MIPAERQRCILQALEQHEIRTIHQLTELLGVSHMTVRRDIANLEAKGRLFSVLGGVQRVESVREEPSHRVKLEMNTEVKRRIAAAAVTLVPANATVYLDAGTTTLALAKLLAERADLLVVSNDLVIANYLAAQGRCRQYLTGGFVDAANHSCVGNLTATFISQLNIDVAFISTSCWDRRGISFPSEHKVVVKKALLEVAKQSVLLADSSKFGRSGAFLGLSNSQFDLVISDSDLPHSFQELLTQQQVALQLV
ncbi:DeoR/GlpR family DNA-binding transcription regulator [Ferrimonas senticii]|uniref:DeoR/GlpR family DNA-binding transcription regulator n=1 Tax=Ferrimonas senticii TaxID=394566 RepID=UPI000483BED2|nr:DeoR/GlpR family DNA-binding transcription regulator [Ferrimonas senticii]